MVGVHTYLWKVQLPSSTKENISTRLQSGCGVHEEETNLGKLAANEGAEQSSFGMYFDKRNL
jgi:hypothetical protein